MAKMMNTRYSAYNLIIDSEIALPELIEIERQNFLPSDVSFRLGKASKNDLATGCDFENWLRAGPDGLWLHIPDVARFLVKDGREISIEPEPGVPADAIRLFLLGSALGALLFQRGHLVLHGNAVRIGDQCMVCVGNSGAGKSTLAAGFALRGYDVLADDVVPVDIDGYALPGFPRIKLWQDTADQMKIETHGLERIRADLNKFNFPVATNFAARALPIRWVYVLRSDHGADIGIRALRGIDRLGPLVQNTYRTGYLEGLALKPSHLQLCAKLASQIHLAEVTRPKAGFALDELMDRLIDDMAAHAQTM